MPGMARIVNLGRPLGNHEPPGVRKFFGACLRLREGTRRATAQLRRHAKQVPVSTLHGP